MSSNLFENPEGSRSNTPSISDTNKEIHRDEDDMEIDALAGASDIELLSDESDYATREPFFLGSDSDDEWVEDDADEDYDFLDAVREAGNFRSRKPKKSAKSSFLKRSMRRTKNDDPEIHHLLALGNKAFVDKDWEGSLEIFREVIRKDNKNFAAYKTLGEIYRELGMLNECCNYWFLAATMNSADGEFWGTVGHLSAELGHTEQAIECYTRAIGASNNKDMKAILARAKLYKEQKRWGRALEGFQKVHLANPTNTKIIKELASIYVEQKRVNDAIKLYMDILDQNINPDAANKHATPKFTWSELNILSELCATLHSYRLGIKVLKLLSRWIQGRLEETWWDEVDDDSEFDARRFLGMDKRPYSEQLAAKEKPYEIPIDIRFKLGTLRLGLGDKDEALRHFEFLKTEENVLDLYWEAGVLLESNGYYEDALTYLVKYEEEESEGEMENEAQLISLLGKCYQEVGEYQKAAAAYEIIIHSMPDDIDTKLALAEVLYHIGEIEASQQLLKEVANQAKKSGEVIEGEEKTQNEGATQGDNAIIQNHIIQRARKTKLSDEEKIELENNAKRKVLEKYHRMQRLEAAIIKGDSVAITAWIQLASQLVEMFMSVRSFFPRDKNRIFKGIVFYRRKKQMGIDEKMARIYNLHEGINTDDSQARLVLTSKKDYRGLDYNIWFTIFVQYALSLAKFEGNLEYAVQITDVATDVSVFVQDKNKEMILKMLRLMFGIAQKDVNATVMTYVRFFLSANQFSPFIYKFFMCCFSSGIEAWETFSNYNHQKFFLRQLKAFDSILTYQKHITGMATLTADVKSIKTKREHAELLYVYANLLGGSRSYVSSIVYLNRAYKHYNRDPMICLVLGLAHVHRSMQRLSSNRHIQLLQGVSYILEYTKHRSLDASPYELQEINYNLGRLFHMLGLTTLAVNSYNKVFALHDSIEDEDFNLLMEAAYNLSLIYNINGNSNLARDITEKYLVV